MENLTIKETTEAGKASLLVAALLVKHLKDGFQVGKDLAAIFAEWQSDAELQAEVKLALEGSNQIPAELKDLSWAEGFQLAGACYPNLLKLIEAWSTSAPKVEEVK